MSAFLVTFQRRHPELDLEVLTDSATAAAEACGEIIREHGPIRMSDTLRIEKTKPSGVSDRPARLSSEGVMGREQAKPSADTRPVNAIPDIALEEARAWAKRALALFEEDPVTSREQAIEAAARVIFDAVAGDGWVNRGWDEATADHRAAYLAGVTAALAGGLVLLPDQLEQVGGIYKPLHRKGWAWTSEDDTEYAIGAVEGTYVPVFRLRDQEVETVEGSQS